MTRPLCLIAAEIAQDWKKPNYAALPYLRAMRWLHTIEDKYGLDSGRSVVAYFLSNASTWRGPVARRVKAELTAMLES
jgi:hypothetical protein